MSMNKKEMKLTSLLKPMIENTLKEESGEYNISVNRDEHYAIYQVLKYAVNKRLSAKITGIDIESLDELLKKIRNSYS